MSGKLTTAIDLLPTLAHACGIDMKQVSKGSPKIDGVNVWETLTGKSTQHPRNDLLYWSGWAVPQAIRVGDWKLYVDGVKGVPGSDKGPALFNLADDPGERTNLVDMHPKMVAAMKAQMKKQLSDLEENNMPIGGSLSRPPKKKSSKWLQ